MTKDTVLPAEHPRRCLGIPGRIMRSKKARDLGQSRGLKATEKALWASRGIYKTQL